MLATRLFERETDAVPAVSTGAGPALLRYVGSHFSSWWWPALGEVPATGQGVLMYESSEHCQPFMVNPGTSSFRLISQAKYRV